ncbi:transcription factor GTE4 isoform X2 [Mercurialis annua]|uniref:transcription factor GTE4 isoform X2 n=1 Tax=Mercurialis annua TaxID=3986 RepID=UPI00215FAEB0|nr:transcription factor GTE4 isoform X2 [Mercurialis annua]
MASATIDGEGGGDVNNNGDGGGAGAGVAVVREKQRYTEHKVYTRKAFRGRKINNFGSATAATNSTTTATTSTATIPAAATTKTVGILATSTATAATDTDNNNDTANVSIANTTITTVENAAVTEDNNKNNGEAEKDEINKDEGNNGGDSIEVPKLQTSALEETNLAKQRPVLRVEVISDDSSSLNRESSAADVAPNGREASAPGNGEVERGLESRAKNQGQDDRLKINLASKSKQEMRELRRKLESELDMVRGLVKRIEAKQVQLGVAGGLSNSRVSVNDGLYNGLKRVSSMGVPREVTTPIVTPTPRQSRPLNQLSISVLENSHGAVENVEKEKRTPKANQFYRNSEFLLAKDKFPPAESNKKSKSNGKKQGGAHVGFGLGKVFKNCSALLDKLMKHKHGWIFNSPVDTKGLGLHDYHLIIKYPMDLGTVKTKLSKNWYKSPEEFAEDVRLTFNNAMRYNPKGQDAHVMAEILLTTFEERWCVIKSDYDRERRFGISYDLGMHTPTSRKAHTLPPPPLDVRRILERTESMPRPPMDPRPKPISTTPSGRTPAPKKPKAKDLHKREMTYEEKQKLSTNLQSLPAEKMDNIVQIINKRNSSLNQQGDEIEVDIDSVDVETLWELDRFVTNFKKSLSKHKRKAELANQVRSEVEKNAPAAAVVAPQETKTVERNVSTSSPVQVENHGDNGTRSSSSSSSSSDSGSSSSDSDSDSSSASESDVGH